MTTVVVAAAFVGGAVALVALARWGREHATELAPSALSRPDRVHQTQVLRRGATACFVVAGVFALAAVGVLL